MGTCCVSGCGELKIIEKEKTISDAKGNVYHEGDYVSIDGSTGMIYGEAIKTQEVKLSGDFSTIMEWADEFRRLKIRTNADNPKDAVNAVSFGAEGIGLCRTEHMFFEEDRIPAMREMILSKTEEQRKRALNKLLPMQKSDFKGIYKAMGERPVTIRFLDPPLHEFLPQEEDEIHALAREMEMSFNELKFTIESLKEFNPMLGHRGCRLAITYPEIAAMQTRAVIEAAVETTREDKIKIHPEIMIPLVGDVKELRYVKDVVTSTAEEVLKEMNAKIDYTVGTMMEIPRACLTADKIAKEAEFFSFGTNDLTQMVFGFSRDDAGKFLDDYYEKKVYEADPFSAIDQAGVGGLMKYAINLARGVKKDLKIGICGEHGGESSSIIFCHNIGMNYVSCSPFRVPIARLAAAHAAILEKKNA